MTEPRARRLRDIFIRLSSRRTSSFDGPNPIQSTEIEAWLRLHQIELVPWELDLIESMDLVLLDAVNTTTKQGDK